METVDQYLEEFSGEILQRMIQLRKLILDLDSEIQEGISYKMPSYKIYGKPLVYFAGYKNHLGLYALPSGHEKFSKKLAIFKQGKGSVQFPLDREMPFQLIEEIIKFRIKENKSFSKTKGKKK